MSRADQVDHRAGSAKVTPQGRLEISPARPQPPWCQGAAVLRVSSLKPSARKPSAVQFQQRSRQTPVEQRRCPPRAMAKLTAHPSTVTPLGWRASPHGPGPTLVNIVAWKLLPIMGTTVGAARPWWNECAVLGIAPSTRPVRSPNRAATAIPCGRRHRCRSWMRPGPQAHEGHPGPAWEGSHPPPAQPRSDGTRSPAWRPWFAAGSG